MANWYCRALLLIALLPLAVLPAAAQDEVPEFKVDLVSARVSTDAPLTRVDVYTLVPYDRLQFLNTTDGFKATYEVAASFYELDDKGRRRNLVLNRIWEREVTTNLFAATRSSSLDDRVVHSVELEPGRYLLQVQLTDGGTNESFVRESPVVVRDLDKPVSVSDLIVIDAFDGDANTITPRVDSRIASTAGHVQLFYEMYAERPAEVRVTREVVLMRKGTSGPTLRSLFGFGASGGAGDVLYTTAEPTRLRKGRTQAVVDLPTEDLEAGEYALRVYLHGRDGTLLDQAERLVTVEWSGLDQHIRDIDEAIAQLEYIAETDDLRYMRGGDSPAERRQRWEAFWEKRDPTPGTERNERMEEYYYRVAYANRRYGGVSSGWQTDRGMVMIRFGEPEEVVRHPYSFDNKPYEIWYYYRKGLKVIFIDETGFGDFQLMFPLGDRRTRIH